MNFKHLLAKAEDIWEKNSTLLLDSKAIPTTRSQDTLMCDFSSEMEEWFSYSTWNFILFWKAKIGVDFAYTRPKMANLRDIAISAQGHIYLHITVLLHWITWDKIYPCTQYCSIVMFVGRTTGQCPTFHCGVLLSQHKLLLKAEQV